MRYPLFSLVAICYTIPVLAIDYIVGTAQELEDIPSLVAGDRVILEAGEYDGVDVTLDCAGTAEAPVKIFSNPAGGAYFSGSTRIEVEGEHAIISGFKFDGLGGPVEKNGVIQFEEGSSNITLHNCLFNNFDQTLFFEAYWVLVHGYNHTIEHCTFQNKFSKNATIFLKPVEGDATKDTPRHHRIASNYFGPRTEVGGNGYETIRIGDSSRQEYQMNCVVEGNYFYQALKTDEVFNEPEIISNKCRGNVFRQNVFQDCDGGLVLRHGQSCIVEENAFLGTGGVTEAGVRVIGSHHQVRNNYFENLGGSLHRGALVIMDGEYERYDSSYEGIDSVQISGNILVNCLQPIHFGFNQDVINPDSSLELEDPPRNITFTDNKFYSATESPLFKVEPDVTGFISISNNEAYNPMGSYGDIEVFGEGLIFNEAIDMENPFLETLVTADTTGHDFQRFFLDEDASQDAAGLTMISPETLRFSTDIPSDSFHTLLVSNDLTNWVNCMDSQDTATEGSVDYTYQLEDLVSEGLIEQDKAVFFKCESHAFPVQNQSYEEVLSDPSDNPEVDEGHLSSNDVSHYSVASGGEVVVEAECYYENNSREDEGSWTVESALDGVLDGGAYIEASDTSTASWLDAAELNYAIYFPEAGTYYFHPRVYAESGSNDSVYFGLGDWNIGTQAGTTSGFAWDNNESEAIEISESGLYRFSIRRRERGFIMDRFILTTDKDAVYTGDGPEVSPVNGEACVYSAP